MWWEGAGELVHWLTLLYLSKCPYEWFPSGVVAGLSDSQRTSLGRPFSPSFPCLVVPKNRAVFVFGGTYSATSCTYDSFNIQVSDLSDRVVH